MTTDDEFDAQFWLDVANNLPRTAYGKGKENINYGKFGKDHPGFGTHRTPETRNILSLQKIGEKNPSSKRW